ncbi:hypothetical protein FACS189483_00140 [Spirochaetia bacterium]|nr:hypothetical protein FACS189483_00140 [Spirochaetia bacterium]
MKKYILCFMLFFGAFFLYAQNTSRADRGWFLNYFDDPEVTTQLNVPRRVFEVTLLDAEVDFSNNMLGVNDILKKHLVINVPDLLNRVPDGFKINVGLNANILGLQFNTKTWGFGITPGGISGGIDLRLPSDLLSFIANGNADKPLLEDSFEISGSVFYEFGVNTHFNIDIAGKPLRIGVDPAFYATALYIPKSSLDIVLDTRDGIYASIGGDFRVYTPVDITDLGSIDVGSLLSRGGVDLSLSAEYPLFTRLDVGASFKHIPIVPATLNQGVQGRIGPIETNGTISDINDLLEDGGLDNLINIPDPLLDLKDFGPLKEIIVVRPVSMNFYALYRPLKSDLLVVKPMIGFTLANNSTDKEIPSDVFFNGSAEVQLHLGAFIPGYLFTLYINTGAEDGFWHNRFGFLFNLRVFELDIEAALRSQDYAGAWDPRGASVRVGLRFGW